MADWRWGRVLTRTVQHTGESHPSYPDENMYRVTLELGFGDREPQPPPVYEVILKAQGEPVPPAVSIWVSDDGSSWTEIFDSAYIQSHLQSGTFRTFVDAGDLRHRYWAMHYDLDFGGGFYGGVQLNTPRLLADLSESTTNCRLGTEGGGGGFYWAYSTSSTPTIIPPPRYQGTCSFAALSGYLDGSPVERSNRPRGRLYGRWRRLGTARHRCRRHRGADDHRPLGLGPRPRMTVGSCLV